MQENCQSMCCHLIKHEKLFQFYVNIRACPLSKLVHSTVQTIPCIGSLSFFIGGDSVIAHLIYNAIKFNNFIPQFCGKCCLTRPNQMACKSNRCCSNGGSVNVNKVIWKRKNINSFMEFLL